MLLLGQASKYYFFLLQVVAVLGNVSPLLFVASTVLKLALDGWVPRPAGDLYRRVCEALLWWFPSPPIEDAVVSQGRVALPPTSAGKGEGALRCCRLAADLFE